MCGSYDTSLTFCILEIFALEMLENFENNFHEETFLAYSNLQPHFTFDGHIVHDRLTTISTQETFFKLPLQNV